MLPRCLFVIAVSERAKYISHVAVIATACLDQQDDSPLLRKADFEPTVITEIYGPVNTGN